MDIGTERVIIGLISSHCTVWENREDQRTALRRATAIQLMLNSDQFLMGFYCYQPKGKH